MEEVKGRREGKKEREIDYVKWNVYGSYLPTLLTNYPIYL